MPVAAIQGDIVTPNPSNHSECGVVAIPILEPLQIKVVFGEIPFAVTGSALTPHNFRVDGSCDPHTVLLGGSRTGAGSTKVTMGGIPANRLADVADGDGLILGPGAIKVIIGG